MDMDAKRMEDDSTMDMDAKRMEDDSTMDMDAKSNEKKNKVVSTTEKE
jgi:hypothetical protein